VVYVEDSNGSPVVLDSIKVVDITNSRDITLQLDDNQSLRGFYPIFSDKNAGDYREQQLQIEFSGFIDGLEVVSEIYKVGADCCHVYHISGNLELVI